MGTTQPIRNKKTLENFRNYYKKEENGRQAVRAGDWKLIRQNIKNGNPTHELYNIAEDPHEDNNLANTYPDKVEELKVIMDREHIHSDIFNFGR